MCLFRVGRLFDGVDDGLQRVEGLQADLLVRADEAPQQIGKATRVDLGLEVRVRPAVEAGER